MTDVALQPAPRWPAPAKWLFGVAVLALALGGVCLVPSADERFQQHRYALASAGADQALKTQDAVLVAARARRIPARTVLTTDRKIGELIEELERHDAELTVLEDRRHARVGLCWGAGALLGLVGLAEVRARR